MAVISRSTPGISTKTLGTFLVLSFGLTWGIVALVILPLDPAPSRAVLSLHGKPESRCVPGSDGRP